jgi:hypothetical protein
VRQIEGEAPTKAEKENKPKRRIIIITSIFLKFLEEIYSLESKGLI